MIQYKKGPYNANLLTRLHGSVLYRAMLPGLVSTGLFFLLHYEYDIPNEEFFDDPTVVSLLVGSTTFLIVFRVNVSYQRYWEACTNVFGMMSRWADAAVHTACYHLQCSHYDHMKPPSYFDHPELNATFLTRDRERIRVRSKAKRKERTFTRSIEQVDQVRIQSRPDQFNLPRHSSSTLGLGEPAAMTGTTRLDGGWGLMFDDEEGVPTSTYFSPDIPESRPDQSGFAGTKGGRTPALFVQELVHLASLLNAVALATLRNDVDGAESPLDVYEVGSPWPSVDSSEFFASETSFMDMLRFLTGADRPPEARTKFNASRPLPVIGGVSNAEIQYLQMARGPMAKTQIAWSWLSEFITREHLAGSQGAVGSPIISQTMLFLGNGMSNYAQARKIMFIPYPFPNAQLSAFFIWMMVPCIPLLLAQYSVEEWVGAVLAFLTVTCFVGLHEVARELENPFRNIPNDIPICNLQAQFNESLVTCYAGYHPDSYWDTIQVDSTGTPSKHNAGVERSRHENKAPYMDVVDEEKMADTNNSNLDDLHELVEQQAKSLVATHAEIERLKRLLHEKEQKTGD